MLGETISDPHNVEGGGEIEGLKLLKINTVFSEDKTTTQKSGVINKLNGFYEKLSGIPVEGYEIHMGQSEIIEGTPMTIGKHINGCVNDNVAGSYIHGFFDNSRSANAIIGILAKRKGISLSEPNNFDIKEYKEKQYDILADCVRKSLDMDRIYEIAGLKNGIKGGMHE